MSTTQYFHTPAFQNDFPDEPAKYQQVLNDWTTNVNGWVQQGMLGNPWNSTNASNQTYFYNPLTTDIPQGTEAAQIPWQAFPNRLMQYFASGQTPANPYSYSDDKILSLADFGYTQQPYRPTNSFQKIPTTLCPQVDWSTPQDEWHLFGPYGPRGWLDEYCEWCVTRDTDNNIVRVDFTCENPEYWNTLWKIDPERVRQLYQDTLNYAVPDAQQITVALEDLQLLDPTTKTPVIDPETGRAAYNPLNKWNSGPVAVRTGDASQFSGGAMHLTSTPNTLQTELGLAGAATVQRKIGNNDPQKLICCSQYGQEYRNSDPTIGRGVNVAVSNQSLACLADPFGLYIQVPDFTAYSIKPSVQLPTGATVADCWQIVRGSLVLVDPVTNQYFPGEYYSSEYQGVGNFILHAVFQIPASWQDLNPAGVTLADILINGQPIQWAGQIARTFTMALYARALPAAQAAPQLDCVGTPAVLANQPLQLMYTDLWNAYYNTLEFNPSGQTMSLASNTTFITPRVEPSASVQMSLTYTPAQTKPPSPTVEFSTPDYQGVDSAIAVSVLGLAPVNYAVPGNSYPSDSYVLTLQVSVAASAAVGMRGVRITDPRQEPAVFAPAVLNIVPTGTLATTT